MAVFFENWKPLLVQDMLISFGETGDGFYTKHNYTAWSVDLFCNSSFLLGSWIRDVFIIVHCAFIIIYAQFCVYYEFTMTVVGLYNLPFSIELSILMKPAWQRVHNPWETAVRPMMIWLMIIHTYTFGFPKG